MPAYKRKNSAGSPLSVLLMNQIRPRDKWKVWTLHNLSPPGQRVPRYLPRVFPEAILGKNYNQ